MSNKLIQIYFPEEGDGIDLIFSYLGLSYKRIGKINSLKKSNIFICQEDKFKENAPHIKRFIESGGNILLIPRSIKKIKNRDYLHKNILIKRNRVYLLRYNIFEIFEILSKDEKGLFNSGKFKRRFPIDSLLYDIAISFQGALFKLDKIQFFKWFWPRDLESAIILSHDVDTANELNDGIPKFRKLEKRMRYNSVWFFRPGDRYEIYPSMLKQMIKEGCEIGLHAINDAYKNKKILTAQKHFIENKMGEKIKGVRNHCLVREVLTTQRVEKDSGFLYESNIPDTDNCVPNYENRGCTFFYPYNLNGVTIFPLTLHDWCFVSGNKFPDKKSMKMYLQKLKYINSKNGLMTSLFHAADYMSGGKRLWMYEKFLNKIPKMKNMWVDLPSNIYLWNKRRNSIKFNVNINEEGIKIEFINGVCTLAMPVSLDNQIKRNISFSYRNKNLLFKIKKIDRYVLFCFKKC